MHATLLHAAPANGAANALLIEATSDPRLDREFFQRQLYGHKLLERARFFELHGCVPGQQFGVAVGGVIRSRYENAAADYRRLLVELENTNTISKFWGQIFGRHKRGVVKRLKVEAQTGLDRVNAVLSADPNLVPHCPH
jgi:hypothetical protein